MPDPNQPTPEHELLEGFEVDDYFVVFNSDEDHEIEITERGTAKLGLQVSDARPDITVTILTTQAQATQLARVLAFFGEHGRLPKREMEEN